MRLPVPPLLIITDRRRARYPLEEIAETVFAAGCRWFSLREKDLPPVARRRLLRALVALGQPYGATISVHDDIDSAIESGAGGLHLPSGSNPEAARARLPGALIGASAHSAEQAAVLLRSGADYVTVSPVFLTTSKPGYGPALGSEGLARIAASVSGPVVALGGITPDSVRLCLAAGAQGVAVMGEVMRAADPQAATAALLGAMARA